MVGLILRSLLIASYDTHRTIKITRSGLKIIHAPIAPCHKYYLGVVARRSAEAQVVPCSGAATQQTQFSGGNPGAGVRFRTFLRCLFLTRHAASSNHSSRLELHKNDHQRGTNNVETASN